MADEAPPAPVGRDSSITVAPEKGAADVDDSDSSTDEEEMNDVMAKLLTKQGKTALGLKEEGNASFKLGTKEVSSHRDSSVPLSPVPVLPFSRSRATNVVRWRTGLPPCGEPLLPGPLPRC